MKVSAKLVEFLGTCAHVCVCKCMCKYVQPVHVRKLPYSVLTYSLSVTSALTDFFLPRFEGGAFPSLNHASSLVSWTMMGEGGASELMWNEMD